jgi:hypothetical protein
MTFKEKKISHSKILVITDLNNLFNFYLIYPFSFCFSFYRLKSEASRRLTNYGLQRECRLLRKKYLFPLLVS